MKKLIINPATLKDVLENITTPEKIDSHAWINSLFVQDFVARNPNLQNRNQGSLLLFAIGELFREMMPQSPPKRGVRLDARWSEFGFLAAKYFSPILFGSPIPASFKDAWERIDSSILLFVYGQQENDLSSEKINPYVLVKNEIGITPTSTISDWHRKGLQRLSMILKTREEYLSTLSSQNKNLVPALKRKKRTSAFYVILGIFLLAFLLGGLKALRIYQTSKLVYEDVNRLQENVEIPRSVEDIEVIIPNLESLQVDLAALRKEVNPFIWAAPLLKWVPIYGCDIAYAPEILDLAENLTAASIESFHASKPLLQAYRSDDVDLNPNSVAKLLVQAQPQFSSARNKTLSAGVSREKIDSECLSPYVRDILLNRVDPLSWLLFDGLIIAIEYPNIVGATYEGPKTYLLLVQNEDELRPSGGFITAAGTLLLQDGQIISLELKNSGTLDDWAKPYPAAPWQLRHYMNSPVLVFRDSNWFPDFSTSALYAEQLYSYISDHSVDGVIAFDQQLLVNILSVTGPIELEDSQDVIDVGNVISYIQASKEWTPERGDEKSSINKIAGALLGKIYGGNVEWDQLLYTVIRLLNERHILLQFDNPRLSDFFARRGWDGSIQPGVGDFLMVVDSNIGFNKTNELVQTNLTYDVDLTDLANPVSNLAVFHLNNADSKIPCVQWHGITLEGQDNYPIDRCYWDYMRVYTPEGTGLIDADPQAIPADWMIRRQTVAAQVDILEEEIDGVQGFGVLKVVPGSQTVVTNFQFSLPASIVKNQLDSDRLKYHLRIQKQPGTLAIPITIRVHFPNNTTFHTFPSEAVIQGADVLLETNLREDRGLEITFQAK